MIYFNFKRNFYLPLDGDLPAIILPVPAYATVMTDPFGMNVLVHDSEYAAPNRFFIHSILTAYFRNVPLWLQQFTQPIDSVYLTAALARTFTQFFLVFLIAAYATGKVKPWDLDFLLAASICVPLFQTYGFYTWMAILDQSVTYMFFYAFSISLVLLYFLPFFNAAIGRTTFQLNRFLVVALAVLCIVSTLSGPLNGPVMLLVSGGILLNYFIINFRKLISIPVAKRIIHSISNIPSPLLGMMALTIFCSIYSYYIGTHNIENRWSFIPMHERYSRLATGLWYHYTFKLAQPLLIGMVILNSFLIRLLKPNEEAKKVRTALRWFAIISVVYILLLPLGGYRIYRSSIVRYDTIMPVTLGLVMFYAYTSIYLLNHIKRKYAIPLYSLLLTGICVFYIHQDWGIREMNRCERSAFTDLANSHDPVVLLTQDCQVMNWGKMKVPGDSKSKTDILLYWNIISEPKLYYQESGEELHSHPETNSNLPDD